MAKGERVNVQRTLMYVGFFYFIFSAGKACLFPFLTVYFRQLGLSATQTGIILGLKPFVALFAAPFWVRCAIRHSKRRVILMAAIFALIATNLGLTLIPPVNKDAPFEFCHLTHGANKTDNYNSSRYMMTPLMGKIEEYVFHTKAKGGTTTLVSPASTTAQPGLATSPQTQAPYHHETALSQTTNSSVLDMLSSMESSKGKNRDEPGESILQQNSVDTGAEKPPDVYNSDNVNSNQVDKGLSDGVEHEGHDASDNDISSNINDDMDIVISNKAIADLKEQLKSKLDELEATPSLRDRRSLTDSNESDINKTDGQLDREKESNNELVRDKEQMSEELLQLEYITFMTALVIVVLGEFMSSSADKLCDDSLYETLDHINEVDKYGRHHIVSLIGVGLAAMGVTVAVHFSKCVIFLDASRFMIHFYAFAILGGSSFLLSFCYPIQDSGRSVRQDKLLRGLGLMLTDFHNIVVAITLVLVGFLSASIQNYMFWLVQDLGGSEVIMGLAVTVSCVAEIPLLFAPGRLTRKLGHMGTLAAAIFALGVRLLYFAYLWTPWAAVPVEILNILCKGALWESVMLYAEQAAPPGMQRSMQMVMVVLYYGFGSSNGSVISGVLYDRVGLKQVYCGFAVVALLWAVVLVGVAKCVPKRRKLHYSKILRDEEDNNNDDIFTDSDEADDWLVNALKNDKF